MVKFERPCLQAKGAKGRGARAALRASSRQESLSRQASDAEDDDDKSAAGSEARLCCHTHRCLSWRPESFNAA